VKTPIHLLLSGYHYYGCQRKTLYSIQKW
jgi:hypothetical protein